MLTIVHKLLDVIFPARDSERVVRSLSNESVTSLYAAKTHESIQYLLPYQTKIGQALIKENKFHRNQLAATHLATLLEKYLREKDFTNVVLMPIPLSANRSKARGYNQVEEILKQIPNRGNVTLDFKCLKRQKDTVAQTSLKREARLSNMKGAFGYEGTAGAYENSVVLIIDDVVTTGATLRAARASLAPHLHPTATVLCLALAH